MVVFKTVFIEWCQYSVTLSVNNLLKKNCWETWNSSVGRVYVEELLDQRPNVLKFLVESNCRNKLDFLVLAHTGFFNYIWNSEGLK